MTNQSLSYWAGAYSTETEYWGGFFSPLIIWGDGTVSVADTFLNTQWDSTTSTLTWDWQEIKDTKAKASIKFSESGNSATFSGSIHPRPQDGPVSFSGTRGSVKGDALPPLPIPSGKQIFYTALVQALKKQYIQLSNSDGTPVFTLEGSSPPPDFRPTPIGNAFFNASDPTGKYLLKIGTDSGQNWSNVLCSFSKIHLGGIKYYHQYVFVSEDSTDQDYNDSYLILYWFEKKG